MDETDYLSEDETDSAADNPLAVGDPNAFLGIYRQNMAAMQRAARTEADLRRQMYEQARARIQQDRFGVPSRSETLMQISQALLQPSKTHGFGSMLGKVMPILAQSMAAPRQAEEQRAAQLAQLQQQYLTQQAAGARAAAAEQLGATGKLAPLFRPQAAPSMGTWSENLGRYIPKDRPVVIKTGVLNGQRVESLSDGTMRMYGADGSVKLFDAGGNLINTGGQ